MKRNNEAEQRRLLYSLLGDLPPRNRKITARIVERSECRNKYVLEKLVLDLNGIEDVPAYFVRPLNSGDSPLPCVLFNHSHGGGYTIGKREFIKGRKYLHNPPYAEALAAEGYSALCIDAWVFGERHHRKETETFKEMLWNGQVLWGMMVYDSIRAVDYLASRKDVDPSRIATLGISMGSTMAWWLAALDTRIKVCVDLCCLTDFQSLIKAGGLDLHSVYYYVPSLLKHFTASQINALIAPRPHLALAGETDELTPPDGLDRIDADLRKVYAVSGNGDAWKLVRSNTDHLETAAMRAEILAFLRKWL